MEGDGGLDEKVNYGQSDEEFEAELDDFIITQVAKVCHEANRAYCLALGDKSQLPWEDAPDWQRTSCINGVKFHADNRDATPEDSHKSWLEEKRRDGWKWGPVKDLDKKEHPCYIEYEKLPVEQRAKDYIFKAIVSNLL